MRILIVAATEMETAPLLAALGDARLKGSRSDARGSRDGHVQGHSYAAHDVDVLTTGVGMVATAAWCSRVLAQTRYDLALNVGVCGTFDRALELGRVVHVVSDRIAELGAEDGDAFLGIDELKLPGEFRFVNAAPPTNAILGALPDVTGITVNTVHGNERSIAALTRRFSPQVESMEGAAFMSACLISATAFAQVRAISNLVERRNRDAWKMSEAIANLNAVAVQILEHA